MTKEKIMNRTRLLVVATMLLVALAASAQQGASMAASMDREHTAASSAANSTEGHLRMLTQSLDLSADQQEKLRPIIQNMLDERQKVLSDTSLSDAQRQEKQRMLHEKADRQA